MDFSTIIALLILLLTAVLLVLIAAAEAGVTAISRARMRNGSASGLSMLLRRYVHHRERVLRNLSVGSSAVSVAGTLALAFIVLDGRAMNPLAGLGIAVVAAITVSVMRQTTRAIVMLEPERWGSRLGRPIGFLQYFFTPLAWFAHLPAELILRLMGRSANEDSDPSEELSALLELESDDTALAEERRMMRGVLDMSEQTVRELMTPRTDLTAVSVDASVGDVMRVITDSGFSRIPLYEESLDRIVGVIYAKDLLAFLRTGDVRPSLREIARPPYFVPETKRANELLADMRRDQVHMAIAVDEYGGTAGVVTVEDLLEEIVGEISDEYDVDEVDVQQTSPDEAIVDARLTIDELNDLFGTDIDSEDFDTVGGLVVTLLGRLAMPGDEVMTTDEQDREPDEALSLRVLSILGRRIKKVRVTRTRASDGVDEPSGEPEASPAR
ncbi:MAG: hemolysin family protein [Chloroflexi bacterium]|nr:hemolysin family protein [Chloroflexota bacterium]